MTKFLMLSLLLSFLLTILSPVEALPTGAKIIAISSLLGELANRDTNPTISTLVGQSPTGGETETLLLQGFTLPTDKELASNILAAFHDAMEMIRKIIDTAAWDTPTFDLYFPPEHRQGVATTYRNMLNGASSKLPFDNVPQPDPDDPAHREFCVSRAFSAWTANTQPFPIIHFCPKTWGWPKFIDSAAKVCATSQMSA
ncbi:MAG: hypothetical protein Q9221_008568 [Calogaya cf. arnoldii]